MTTKRDLIVQRYQYLKSQLHNYIDGSSFPSLDDYGITDIIYYLNLYLPKGGEQEYINTIEKLMKQKQIELNDDDFSKATNLIIDFINFLNNL